MPARSEGRHRLVFLHGFTQTHHHWHPAARAVARELGDDPTLAFVDLPGHGLSADDRCTMADSGSRLARLTGAGIAIGYSMGGRFALHAALDADAALDGLVLIGATAGIDEEDARAERRTLDEQRARRVERAGVAAFLDEWLAAPLFASLPPDPAGLEHRRRNSADGLASSLRDAGTGSMTPLWHSLDRIVLPTLVIAGELDEKFTAIGRRMADTVPNGAFASIPGAGHAVHLERPEETAAVIARWLRSVCR